MRMDESCSSLEAGIEISIGSIRVLFFGVVGDDLNRDHFGPVQDTKYCAKSKFYFGFIRLSRLLYLGWLTKTCVYVDVYSITELVETQKSLLNVNFG